MITKFCLNIINETLYIVILYTAPLWGWPDVLSKQAVGHCVYIHVLINASAFSWYYCQPIYNCSNVRYICLIYRTLAGQNLKLMYSNQIVIHDRGKASLDVQHTSCLLVCNVRLFLCNDKNSGWNYSYQVIRFLHHIIRLTPIVKML